jgi:hypothetical protein
VSALPLPELHEAPVREAVERVLSDELHWFPVRHHSPRVARHLEAAIRERKPRVVFVEGPSEATDLVRFVVHPRTRPPVALYSSFRDDHDVLGLSDGAGPGERVPARLAAWYPLLAYSPEYVAMKTASAIGAEVELIDLPHAALVRRLPAGAEDAPPAPPPDPEAALVESRFYQGLAEAAGFRSWDQAWDSLFEFGDAVRDRETFRRELATFCAAARATAAPERLAADGTRERERFMWRAIRAGLERRGLRPAQAMVVCGGFHLFLDREDQTPPPDIPAGTWLTSVVPYSFFRVSELSGYGAGNRAPQFYQSVWELGEGGDLDELLARHVVATLKRARRAGEMVSSADAISVAQHARMLAALRQRGTPILDDVHDALFTCCCKGSPERHGGPLREAIDATDIGSRIGAVTPELGRLPLVADFHEQLVRLELGEVIDQEKRITVRIDRREGDGRSRSAFLHRLAFLKVPLVELFEAGGAGPTGGTLFKEVWRLLWSPEVEPTLVECALYGDTIETASLTRLREQLAQHADQAGLTAQRLREALEMDLPTLVDEAERACRAAVATDPRFVSLATGLRHIQVLRRQLVYQQVRRERFDDLVEQCFDRACFALGEAANAPDAEQEHIVEALRVVAETLLGDESGALDRDVLVQHVRGAADASQVPFLRGAFLGMLAELRVASPEDTSSALAAWAREPPERMVAAGEFLDGMLAASRTSLLLGADHLVNAVDDLLAAADHDAFLVMLPRLRSAFGRLHERQRQTLADRVAQRHGLKEPEQLTRLSTSVAAGVLLARLDERAGRILSEWGF